MAYVEYKTDSEILIDKRNHEVTFIRGDLADKFFQWYFSNEGRSADAA